MNFRDCARIGSLSSLRFAPSASRARVVGANFANFRAALSVRTWTVRGLPATFHRTRNLNS